VEGGRERLNGWAHSALAHDCPPPRLAFAGIMQPVKNGRTDMPPGVLEGMGDGGGQLQVDQLQALQEAGYLAQMQDQAASSGFSAMAPAPAGLPSSLGPGCDLSGMGSQMGSASGSASGDGQPKCE